MYVTERCQELLTCQATSTPKKKAYQLVLKYETALPTSPESQQQCLSGLDAKQTLERRLPGSFSRCGAEQVRDIHQMKSALVDTVKVQLELKLA